MTNEMVFENETSLAQLMSPASGLQQIIVTSYNVFIDTLRPTYIKITKRKKKKQKPVWG